MEKSSSIFFLISRGVIGSELALSQMTWSPHSSGERLGHFDDSACNGTTVGGADYVAPPLAAAHAHTGLWCSNGAHLP